MEVVGTFSCFYFRFVSSGTQSSQGKSLASLGNLYRKKQISQRFKKKCKGLKTMENFVKHSKYQYCLFSHSVLVLGGSGGIGNFAIQVCQLAFHEEKKEIKTQNKIPDGSVRILWNCLELRTFFIRIYFACQLSVNGDSTEFELPVLILPGVLTRILLIRFWHCCKTFKQ